MKKKILQISKANVIGCGPWAQNHIRILANKNFLNGVYDLNPEILRNTAKQYNCKKLNKKDLLNQDEDKCLFILSSADSHFQLLKKFIPYYKNIFVEKPVVENLKQFNEIKDLSNKYKSKIVVGHIINYHPAFQKLLNIVSSGDIGDIFSIKSIRHNFGRFRVNEDVIKSLSIHDLSINLQIAKKLKIKLKNFSFYGFDFIQKNHFDEARIFLEFSNNVKSIISSSWTSPNKNHLLQIIGSKGIIVFDDTISSFNEKLYIQFYQKIQNDFTKTFRKFINIDNQIEPLENEIEHTFNYFCGETSSVLTPLQESYEIIKIIDSFKKTNKNFVRVNL